MWNSGIHISIMNVRKVQSLLMAQSYRFFFDHVAAVVVHVTKLFLFARILLLERVLNEVPVFVSSHFEKVFDILSYPDLILR